MRNTSLCEVAEISQKDCVTCTSFLKKLLQNCVSYRQFEHILASTDMNQGKNIRFLLSRQ